MFIDNTFGGPYIISYLVSLDLKLQPTWLQITSAFILKITFKVFLRNRILSKSYLIKQ